MKFIPRLSHQGTPHSPTYFNKASVLLFFFFCEKKEKKRGLIKLRSTLVHSEFIQQYPSCSNAPSLGRPAEKRERPRPLYGAALHSICCPLVAIVNVVR